MRKFSQLLAAVALCLVAVVAVAGLTYEPNAYATKDLFKAAKDMYGKDIKGCKHCHVKPLPREGSADLNEVGSWLVEQKEEKGAEEVDVAWLKEYKPE